MMPFNGSFDDELNLNYPAATREECCRRFNTQLDPTLLDACIEQIDSLVCEHEVYETTSDQCDSVTLTRSVFMATESSVGVILYENE